jgi:hypothetical protein
MFLFPANFVHWMIFPLHTRFAQLAVDYSRLHGDACRTVILTHFGTLLAPPPGASCVIACFSSRTHVATGSFLSQTKLA